jgi:hypothetical protein
MFIDKLQTLTNCMSTGILQGAQNRENVVAFHLKKN